jgi:hypothetical protein
MTRAAFRVNGGGAMSLHGSVTAVTPGAKMEPRLQL